MRRGRGPPGRRFDEQRRQAGPSALPPRGRGGRLRSSKERTDDGSTATHTLGAAIHCETHPPSLSVILAPFWRRVSSVDQAAVVHAAAVVSIRPAEGIDMQQRHWDPRTREQPRLRDPRVDEGRLVRNLVLGISVADPRPRGGGRVENGQLPCDQMSHEARTRECKTTGV